MHRTTIRLNEHLLIDAKAYAVRRRLSLTAVIEEALRSLLARTPAPRALEIPASEVSHV